VAVLAFGTLLHMAKPAAQQLDMTLVDMRWVKPLDEALLTELCKTHDCFVTIEEGAVAGGAGTAVLEWLHSTGRRCEVLQLGLPDTFIEHGDPAALLAGVGLSAQGVEASIRERFFGVM
jgi:1-deoxy-D-xylulose-5-phosphate synthase